MRNTARQTRDNRTIPSDFQADTTSGRLLDEGKAFVARVMAVILSIGFQLQHQAACRGGGGLTRPAHSARVRRGGRTIWRRQGTTPNAVFTVLPHCVVRYRQMPPEVARAALLAPPGGRRLERCAVLCHLSPMALSRLVWALGQQSLVGVLPRGGFPLPLYCLAAETQSHCRTDKVDLPTSGSGRVLGPLGDPEEARAAAFTQSYQAFQRAALQPEPASRVRGVLPDGVDSPTQSRRTLVPGARLGFCLRHALRTLPKKLAARASPVRPSLRAQFHPRLSRVRQRQSLRVVALGPRLRHFADPGAQKAGVANGERVRRWLQAKKAGWYAVLEAPHRPVTSPRLDQAQNALERKLFALKGFHHPGGSQPACLTGLAHLYNLAPYQRRAQQAGQGGVEVEGGRVPPQDGFLTLQMLTSGGFRRGGSPSTT